VAFQAELSSELSAELWIEECLIGGKQGHVDLPREETLKRYSVGLPPGSL